MHDVCGVQAGPSVYGVMATIGKRRSLERLVAASIAGVSPLPSPSPYGSRVGCSGASIAWRKCPFLTPIAISVLILTLLSLCARISSRGLHSLQWLDASPGAVADGLHSLRRLDASPGAVADRHRATTDVFRS